MLLGKLKTARTEFLKGTKVDVDKLRIFMEDMVNMSPELKERLTAELGDE
jgi:hypothetical protein